MELTKLIFDYWKIWMTVPDATNLWANEVLDEGFTFADGFCVTFWWILNKEYYKMQNKMYAYTGCDEPFEEPRDFEDFYE